MRIGMVAWSFYPRVGGSVTTVMQLSKSLVENGIEVDIVAPLLQKDIYKIKGLNLDKRIKIHWVISSFARSYSDFYSRGIFFLKMTIKIRTMSRYVDVFHAHDFNISLLSAIIGTNKAVISVFGADPLFEAFNYKRKSYINYEEFLKNRIIIILQKIINAAIFIISGNRLTVISLNKYLNKIIERYHGGQVVNIPAGINLDLYRSNRIGERKTKSILVVARFMPWKEIGKAIEIFMKVKRFNKEAEMILIGGGLMQRHYIAKYKNAEGLRFIGDMDCQKTIEYYKKADIFLITSQYETFGITVIEAMAAGLAVVASDLHVFHDRLTDDINCYLVSGGDVSVFADRILSVLNNASIRGKFINNSLNIVENYNIDRICGSYISLYNKLSKL